jgi:hypothetical protein
MRLVLLSRSRRIITTQRKMLIVVLRQETGFGMQHTIDIGAGARTIMPGSGLQSSKVLECEYLGPGLA